MVSESYQRVQCQWKNKETCCSRINAHTHLRTSQRAQTQPYSRRSKSRPAQPGAGPGPTLLHQRGGERGVRKHIRLKGEPTVKGALWRGLPLLVQLVCFVSIRSHGLSSPLPSDGGTLHFLAASTCRHAFIRHAFPSCFPTFLRGRGQVKAVRPCFSSTLPLAVPTAVPRPFHGWSGGAAGGVAVRVPTTPVELLCRHLSLNY